MKEKGPIRLIRPISPIGPIILRPSLLTEAECFAEWEQEPDTAPHILPYSTQEHRAEMAKADVRYLTLLDSGNLRSVGFMILLPQGRILGLKRWVIGPKGVGYGALSLRALCRYGVDEGAERLWLDVFADNERARHVYEKAGFGVVDELDFFGRRLLVYEKNLPNPGSEKEI